MSRHEDRTNVLRTLLDDAGIEYTLEPDHLGGVARFRYGYPGGPMFDLAVFVRGQELRITVRRALHWDGSDAMLRWCFEVDAEWCFGQLYHVPRTDVLDASLSLYLGGDLPPVQDLRDSLRHLVESVHQLRAGYLPRYQPSPEARATSLDEVRHSLDALGATYSDSPDGRTVVLRYRIDDVPLKVGVYLFDGSILNLRSQLPPECRAPDRVAALHAIHDWNAALSSGYVALGEDDRFFYHLPVPLLWSAPDAALLDWGIGMATHTLVDMKKGLGLSI